MSINFPNSPAVDQLYTTPDGASFVWNGKQWVGFSSTVNLNLSILNPLLVKDSGTVVGTVTAINFADYLDVTYSNYAVDVNVNQVWTESLGGIYRLGNIGIGTTNPVCFLEVGTPGGSGRLVRINGGAEITGLTTISISGPEGYLTIGGETAESGVWVGYNQGNTNLVFGRNSGKNIGVNAKRNIFIGDQSGRDITNNSASDNIIFGAYAGLSYQNSSNNIFIGNGVGNNIDQTSLSGSYNVIIGPTGGGGSTWDQNNDSALLLPPNPTGSYQLVIGAGNTAWIHGNSSFNIGLGTNNPLARLDVVGGSRISGIATASEISIGLGYTYSRLSSSGLNLYLNEINESSKIYFQSYNPGNTPTTVVLEAPEGADNYTLTLPATNGTLSQLLTSDGEGNLYWSNPMRWYDTATGIHTSYRVSIGTTNATSQLTVQGDASISGIITAGGFSGPGIVTSIIAGSNVTIDQSTGAVTISASGGGNGSSQWVTTGVGINTLSNVSIGTTLSSRTLTVAGTGASLSQLVVTGVSTFGSSTEIISSGEVKIAKDNRIMFGYSGDTPNGLVIRYTDAFGSEIVDVGGSSITINADAGKSVILKDDNTNFASFNSAGVTLTGITTTSSINVGSAGTVLATTSNGNVGVGTASPTSKLSVNGTFNVVGLSTFTNTVRVGLITDGLNTNLGLSISSTDGTVISNNGGSSGGFYLRTNGTHRWYVDYLGAQFNTGKFEVGPNIATPNARIDTSGNANFVGVVTATTLFDSKGQIRRLPQTLVGTAYTLTVSDSGKHVAISTGGITVPANIFSIGDVITIYNNNPGVQMLTPSSGVSLRLSGIADTGAKGLNGYALATMLCVSANTFALSGTGITG